jgi:DNA polymerase-1
VLHLIDASVFIFRAYHSVPIAVTDLDGNPVNALHGFGRFLGDLIEQVRPEHIAVAFDATLVTSFRNRLFPAYKANREPAPADLKRQFILCRELCESLGVASFASPEYEAELVRPGDQYWDYIGEERYDYDDIADRFGVVPERMACFLALTGDAVDNIPGVPGVGRKTASMLFRHFESLVHLYDDLDRVLKLKLRNPGFVAGQLREHRESAFLARQLTGIACDMPLHVELNDLARRPPDFTRLNDLYDAAGFGRLLRNQAERVAAC